MQVDGIPKGLSFLEFATKRIVSNQNSISRAPYQVLLLVSQKYNFRMHLKRTSDYGRLVDNCTRWTGLMGYLQRKEVDFASQSFVYALKRMPVMDSGFSATKYRHFFVFRHPDYHFNMKNPFLRPLDDIVWSVILLVSSVTVFALFLIKRTEDSEMYNANESFAMSVLNIVGIFALQGLCSDIWTSLRARFILLLMLMLSFISYQFYSGAIVGSLLAPPPRTITTLAKITESRMKIILEETQSNHVVFKFSFGADLMELYEKRVKGQEIYVSMEDGLKMMREGPNVFLTNVDESYDYIRRLFTHEEREHLQEIAYFSQETTMAALYIPIQKHSPFGEIIRVGVIRLSEIGIKPYVVKKWELKLPKSDGSKNILKKIDIDRTVSVFYLLIIGQLTSFVVLFLETFLKRICKCFVSLGIFYVNLLLRNCHKKS